ncbi:hypothetical protein JJD41_23505 [Oxynema sp. CENA135]|uniref:hypothetical protein n=1 Tax=Oxynema sp. CENA135 TaxID=984206 RepID=UPI00190D7761|nr:hypothetical protein [Oxynema sp. CENA135]MBK4732810.1 hypothetical protein [Oxynema sp. CENA135]
MSPLNPIEEVVRDLERDPNLIRIKKLLVCVCEGKWENNRETLDDLDLVELLETVKDRAPNLVQLRSILGEIVRKLNKPKPYSVLAQALIKKVGKIYPDSPDDERSRDPQQELKPDLFKDGDTGQRSDFNRTLDSDRKIAPETLYNLKYKIVRHTSPLRAKILIFSTLYHPFSFSDRDWIALKQKPLDLLLTQLFASCKNLTELEAELYITARAIDNSDENLQTASVIVQYLIPLYDDLPDTDEDDSGVLDGEDLSAATNGDGDDDCLELQASRLMTPTGPSEPLEARDRPEDSETNPEAPPTPTPEPISASSAPSESVPAPPAPVEAIAPTPGDRPAEDPNSSSPGKFSLQNLDGDDPSELHKKRVAEQIQRMVTYSVNDVTSFIENQLHQLELKLETRLLGRDLEESLSLKYEALGDFIVRVKSSTLQFLEVLSQLEEGERKQFLDRVSDSNKREQP